ncbi:MAG: D-glycero-beta-D-manno-heptose 1,7-bisphosphate 7-phosphatase [Bacteroidota bacterium]
MKPERKPQEKPAIGLLLDRDGTVNVDLDFLVRPEDLVLIPGSAEAIREANRLGLKVAIITNQSGIARGLFTVQDLARVHEKLESALAQHGARVDAIFFCPHHPELGFPPYRKDCTCRKPKTGMIVQAAKELHLDLRRSYVVGDRCIDMKAGEAAGCGTILVQTGYGTVEMEECMRETRVDHVAKNLKEGWRYIKHDLESRNLL